MQFISYFYLFTDKIMDSSLL